MATSKDAPPKDFPQVAPPAAFDQLAIMQSLIDIHKDLAALGTKTDRTVSDLKELRSDLKGDLQQIHADSLNGTVGLAELKVRVDHLPTKGFIIIALVAALTLLGGAITFQDQVRGFFMPHAANSQPTPGLPSQP